MYKDPNMIQKMRSASKKLDASTIAKVKQAAKEQMAAPSVEPSIWY